MCSVLFFWNNSTSFFDYRKLMSKDGNLCILWLEKMFFSWQAPINKYSCSHLQQSYDLTFMWKEDVTLDYTMVHTMVFNQAYNRLLPFSLLCLSWTMHWLDYFCIELWFLGGNHVNILFLSCCFVLSIQTSVVQD